MLSWALTFFVIALIASVFGFTGVAGLSAEIGWLFAMIAVIFLVVGTVARLAGGSAPPPPSP